MNKEVIILLSIIAVILIVVIYVFMIKYLKGKLKLNLTKTSFQNPEKIEWILDLEAKKNIAGNRLFIALVQYEKTRKRDNEGKIETTKYEIWRFEVDIEQAKEFPSWFKNSYKFEIPFPSDNQNTNNPLLNNKITNTLSKWINLLGWAYLWTKNIEWYVEARLDAKGIDLTDSKRIYLN